MSCNFVIEYFLSTKDDNTISRVISFDMVGFCVEEINVIKEFYYFLKYINLKNLKSFYIFNFSKKYDIKGNECIEPYNKLYYKVLNKD